jgi:DNA-binding MarR family transcriptional regulator
LSSEDSARGWQFVTNHTQVLLCIANDPDARLRDIADSVGITVGSAQRIVADLIEGGFVERTREGRRNRYVVNRDSPMLRHAAQDGHQIGGLLELLELGDA